MYNSDFSIAPGLDCEPLEESDMFRYVGKPLAITNIVNCFGKVTIQLEGSAWSWNPLWLKKPDITEGVLTKAELWEGYDEAGVYSFAVRHFHDCEGILTKEEIDIIDKLNKL